MRKSPTAAWLFIEKGARAGASLRLGAAPALIGRDPEAALRLDPHQDILASGRHAMVQPSGQGWEIRDLGSRNGTWVNGERLAGSRLLEPGDRIRLGAKGPVVLFTNDAPPGAGTGGRKSPTTRAAPALAPTLGTARPRRSVLLGGGLGVLVVLALLAVWSGWPSAGSPAADAPPASSATGGDVGVVVVPDTFETLPGPDTAAARMGAELEALRDQVERMETALEAAERETGRLRRDLETARRAGASEAEVDSLERELREANTRHQTSDAALRRQQLAGSLDFDELGAASSPATAQIFVEFEGGRTIAATAFGADRPGRLLTNKHVVSRDGVALLRLGVQYANSRTVLPARVAAVSPAYDVALIEVVEGGGSLPFLDRFNQRVDTLSLPAPVVMFGFPLGGQGGAGAGVARPLHTGGVLMGRDRRILELEGYGEVGASGSPIVDAGGQVIGLLVGGRTTEAGKRLYAVPAPRILDFLRGVSGGR